MKLKDKTTLAELRELIGKIGHTRTTKHDYTVEGLEIDKNEIFVLTRENGRKRRITLKYFESLKDKKEEKTEQTPRKEMKERCCYTCRANYRMLSEDVKICPTCKGWLRNGKLPQELAKPPVPQQNEVQGLDLEDR